MSLAGRLSATYVVNTYYGGAIVCKQLDVRKGHLISLQNDFSATKPAFISKQLMCSLVSALVHMPPVVVL